MKAAWAKKGWKEGDGYPDIVVMKWTGDEGGRSQYTRRYIAEAADGSGQGKAAGLFRPTARSDGSNAGGSPTGQDRPDPVTEMELLGMYEMITEEVLPVSLPI